jgi:hypothetical protein
MGTQRKEVTKRTQSHVTVTLIAHKTEIPRNPPIHSFTGDGKRLDRPLTDQHISTLRF